MFYINMKHLYLLILTVLTAAEDCPTLYIYNGSECVRKDLLPLSMSEVFGVLLIFLASILANATGIGGGGIFVPVLILIMGFTITEAIPLSKALILGGAIAALIVNWSRIHPYSNISLINFPVVSLLHPMLMLGTIIGVILNRAFPEWLILTLLIVTLVGVTKKTFQK